MNTYLPKPSYKRIVIIGGGFAGLKLARSLRNSIYQIVLVDRVNYHQFQPLFYQVATAGLEPSSISFPFRKIFQNFNNFHFRLASAERIDPVNKTLHTDKGPIEYDYLILSMGADTNYFNNQKLASSTLAMKSIPEALEIRNRILENYEQALLLKDVSGVEKYLNIVIVGGGPTGVEVAGAMAEMRRYILPKDYPELDFAKMRIILTEGATRLLGAMSEASSAKALEYLKGLGVEVILNDFVTDYEDGTVILKSGNKIPSLSVIWAAGVKANQIQGLPDSCYGAGGRLLVDKFNHVSGTDNIYCLGDASLMILDSFPKGHPQVAPVAVKQALQLSANLIAFSKGESMKPFDYESQGSMATIGRNLAVVELGWASFQGFMAWLTWMFIHLMLILGIKNRLFIFINWAWSYITFDQSLRLVIRPRKTMNNKG